MAFHVYTLGYAAKNANQRLEQVMQMPRLVLVDIRLRPASRFHPAFRQYALVDRFGSRYCHLPALGNLNYQKRDRGIQLADPDQGIQQLVGLMHNERPVCLLCACARPESCHRRVVSDLIADYFGSWCVVTHL